MGQAATGGVVIVPPLKPLVEAKLGKPIGLPTLYLMLSRHGWCKLAPDPKSDPAAQGEWEKLPERLATEIAAFAVPRPLRLMFQDEARSGRISDVRHCWDKKPHRPMVSAMVTQDYTYAYGAVSPADGRFDSLVLHQVNGCCMQLFLDEISARYRDHGDGWGGLAHRVGRERAHGFLPPYAPELNPQEHIWDELREKFFHNRAFDTLDSLETHLEGALKGLESNPERMRSIAGWDWIINSVSN